MKPRELLVLLSALALIVIAVLALGLGANPAQAAGPEPIELEEPIAAAAPQEDLADEPEAAVHGTPVTGVARASLPEGPAPTSGTIFGRISMAPELFAEVATYAITVEERRNPNTSRVHEKPPWRHVQNFKVPSNRTPRFEIRDVPFCRYPYEVKVFAVGYNGSVRTVSIDAEHPYAGNGNDGSDDVELVLELSRGVPFNVLLRDPMNNAVIDTDIVVVPYHEGGQIYRGKSDSFGQVRFDAMLAGTYQVQIEGSVIDDIEVSKLSYVRNGTQVRGQYAKVVVHQGRTLKVEVFDAAHMGFADVKLELFAVETTENRRHEATTDYTGTHTFDYLRPGKYQLDVHHVGFQRTSRIVRVLPDENPKPVRVTLHRHR